MSYVYLITKKQGFALQCPSCHHPDVKSGAIYTRRSTLDSEAGLTMTTR